AAIELPPFVVFYVAALLAVFCRGWLRGAVMLAAPVLGGINLWLIPEGNYWLVSFLDFELSLFRADRLALLFGYLFHIAALIAIIYSLHIKDRLQQTASLLYAGSALGAVFAGD